MSPETEPDWQKKLDKIEQDISQTWSEQSPQVTGEVTGWFKELPTVGKAAIVVGGTFVAISILSSIFKLVTALISLGVIALLGYAIYSLVIAKKD